MAGKNSGKKMDSSLKWWIIVGAVLVVILGILYYINVPSISIYESKTWIILIVILFVAGCINCKYDTIGKKLTMKPNILGKILYIAAAAITVIFLIGALISSEIFSAHKYASLIDVQDANFTDDIVEKAKIDDIALMDTASATIVGERTIGSLSNVVSQFEVSKEYSQIELNGKPMKVAPLEYADFFKYMNNKKDGIPGYVKVDPITNEATYVELSTPMKYAKSGKFNSSLKRHLRFKYPTAIFEGYYFEIDEEGNPYYVCPVMKAHVGLFGAMDVKGVVLCDPTDGDCEYYSIDEVPDWVDRAYDGQQLLTKYDWYGELSGGFWNSIFGNVGCKTTTDDYGYKIMEDDMWIYTGVTSVNGDESNIGFVLMNTRTSESRYYSVSGAEEYSAMSAAQGEVQHLGYVASFPSLINVSNQPTYIMVLKDNGGLVKMYAFVNIQKYNLVATGTTQKEALSAYKKLLLDNGILDDTAESLDIYENKTITVKEVRYIVDGDTTFCYITDTKDVVYKQDFSEDESLIFIDAGEKIKVYYEESEDGINTLIKYE